MCVVFDAEFAFHVTYARFVISWATMVFGSSNLHEEAAQHRVTLISPLLFLNHTSASPPTVSPLLSILKRSDVEKVNIKVLNHSNAGPYNQNNIKDQTVAPREQSSFY